MFKDKKEYKKEREAKTIEVVFEKDIETKDSIGFWEVDASLEGEEVEVSLGDVLGSIYIKKWVLEEVFPKGLPKRLLLTIEEYNL